jgi:hypothetical protein
MEASPKPSHLFQTPKVAYLPVPQNMGEQQRQSWEDRAAYWAIQEDFAQRALETAQRNIEGCLRMLGHTGTQLEFPDGA